VLKAFEAARLQIHVNFHENLEMFIKVNLCEVNNYSNLPIAIDTYNLRKLTKSGQDMQKQ
jgi:hypothetical protein